MRHEQVARRDVDAILDQRARMLAESKAAGTDRVVEVSAAVVGVGQERLAIPAVDLREIIRVTPIARLPEVPEWCAGLTHVRGELLVAVDLGRWLGIRAGSEPGFLAVIEASRGVLGLLVDAVLGVRHIYQDEMAQRLSTTATGHPVLGTTRDLVTILDARGLLESPQIVVRSLGLHPRAADTNGPAARPERAERS